MEQLLATKLFIPATRPELVSRTRLVKQLNRGLPYKLTLVSAPAGFGKTTFVTEWLKSNGDDASSPFFAAWLSLDEGDNNVIRFLTYLITTLNHLQGLETEIGGWALQMIQSPQPPSPKTILIALINEIARLAEKIVLVLDDYHLIDSQPVHDAITFLLENLPPKFHLVITTREDPPLQISRLRARGQLTEIRAVDLRFTSAETAEFLNQIMGLNLAAEDIAALETRTEGWITGLQMAAISMQGSKDVDGFIKSFTGSHRYVLDYLIEEVLDQQPKNVQTFMLQTAILDRLTGSLCDAVTGQANGQGTLEMLERANLFIFPLDDDRRWYRYHHLFADLLNRRLHQTQPEGVSELHIRASEWFNQQGASREAIRHSLVAKDFKKAIELVEAIAIDILQQGEHTSVVGWVNEIPEELVNSQPYLCVLHAWALLLSGEMDTAESRLLDAEKALEILGHKDGQRDYTIISGLIHTNRAYLTFMAGEHDKTISYARKALKELPDSAALFRAQTGIYLGAAYRHQGQLQESFDTYNKILPITQQLGGKIAVLCCQNMGDLLWQMAKLKQAQDVLEKALQLTEQHAGRPDMPYCGFVYVLIGRILHQRGELTEAHQLIKTGFALCQEWNLPEILGLGCLELANIHWALGNHDQAREYYQEASQIFGGISSWGRKYAAAYQAKFDIAMGDIEAAERWAQSNNLATDGDFEFHREIEYLSLARLLKFQKKFVEAHALVERINHIAHEIGNKRTELESMILLSLIIYDQGYADQALEHLHKALTIAEPERFIHIFVDEGPPMARMLYEALSRGIAPAYVQKLLAAFPIEQPEQMHQTPIQSHESEWIEPLSDRELEVLHLIAEGLSRQEIATRLVLSLNTVKTHSRNIYSKLGVNNQMKAVGKARALGLLENE